jgi:catalase
LSLTAYPGDGSAKGRKVAIVVADGTDGEAARDIYMQLLAEGAVPRFIGDKLGSVGSSSGSDLEVEITISAAPAVLFDAMVLPDGEPAIASLMANPLVHAFVRDQYFHCKPILCLGAAEDLLAQLGISQTLEDGSVDEALFLGGTAGDIEAFKTALGAPRQFDREAA